MTKKSSFKGVDIISMFYVQAVIYEGSAAAIAKDILEMRLHFRRSEHHMFQDVTEHLFLVWPLFVVFGAWPVMGVGYGRPQPDHCVNTGTGQDECEQRIVMWMGMFEFKCY